MLLFLSYSSALDRSVCTSGVLLSCTLPPSVLFFYVTLEESVQWTPLFAVSSGRRDITRSVWSIPSGLFWGWSVQLFSVWQLHTTIGAVSKQSSGKFSSLSYGCKRSPVLWVMSPVQSSHVVHPGNKSTYIHIQLLVSSSNAPLFPTALPLLVAVPALSLNHNTTKWLNNKLHRLAAVASVAQLVCIKTWWFFDTVVHHGPCTGPLRAAASLLVQKPLGQTLVWF